MATATTIITRIAATFTLLNFTSITCSLVNQYPVKKKGKKTNVLDKLNEWPMSPRYPTPNPTASAMVIPNMAGNFLNQNNNICQLNRLTRNHKDQCGEKIPVNQPSFPIKK